MTPADIRTRLKAAREALQQRYAAQPMPPQRLLRSHSAIVDEHLRLVWQMLAVPPQLALAAVGGYGRRELFPKSDIDLLILLPQPPDGALEERLRELIGVLWDIGLEVGHSIRSVEDCITECADVTVQTNLLEARLITGDTPLFEQMRAALRAGLNRRNFFQAKQQEQIKRHARFLDTDYNLEPNLKESPGGLRDLQTVLWISRASGFGGTWRELAEAGLITPTEARAIARHEGLLQTLRLRLHYLARRREDRLLFDHQAALAEQMGIHSPSARRASEQLMKRYYRTRRAVLLLNEVLLQALHTRLFPESGATYPLNARFIARDTLLEVRHEALFEQEPSALLEAFALLQQHPRLSGFSAPTLRALWRARPLVNARFRRDPQNQALFMRLLRQPQGLTRVLRLMNRLDVLGRYLPAFGRIVGQMQHDLFHIHTVDEHILMVVRNLRRFTVAGMAHEFPLCSELIRDFARPEVLYVAGLFHDIAKGRGGDHSQLGRADADRFCRLHGLSSEDRELVVWLVEQHLAMSSTAQKQDLSDQDVIAAFAARIRNERHLVALYLLTVADIRGTSPKVWNAWKGKLLEDLFNATRRYLRGGKVADQAGEARQAAQQTLALYAIAPDNFQLLWAQLDNDYFLQHEPHEIAWHTRQLAHRVNVAQPLVKARLSRIGEGIQIMVYSPDQPHLFVRICSFFESLNYNIVEAKIHTTQHGYALDSFLVMDASGNKTPYRDVMSYIEHELATQLGRNDALPAARGGRINRQLKHFPIAPEVLIERDDKGRHLLSLIAGDRPGLLARVAHVFASHGIAVRSAKINTLGSRAEDTFWVTGAALESPQQSRDLRDALLLKLQ